MTQDEAEDLLDELLKVESGLRPNEMDFIESLNNQRGGTWSDKQKEWLEDIGKRLGV